MGMKHAVMEIVIFIGKAESIGAKENSKVSVLVVVWICATEFPLNFYKRNNIHRKLYIILSCLHTGSYT